MAFLCFIGTLLLLVSCGKHDFNEPNLVQVTFCNESSYSVTVYQKSFDGHVLAEKLIPAECFSSGVNPSNNHGVGTVFSVEYWHLIDNEVWVGGRDPNRQITENIEAGESYVISIPQPSSLDFQESFIKIANASGMDFELGCLNAVFYQVNGALPVPSGKTGLYKADNSSACYYSNGEIRGYAIKQGLLGNPYPFPEFIAMKGYIHNFKFDGNEVVQTGDQKIIF
jgi:hypothetical protein